jgi:ADP-heptose:LPS heptosyltransferase
MLDLNKIKNVLAIRYDAVGDMVVALPTLQALKKAYPHLNISVAASNYSPNADILPPLDFIDQILICPPFDKAQHFFTWLKFFRKHKFDLILHFSPAPVIAWAAFFTTKYNIGDKAVLSCWPVFKRLGFYYTPNNIMSHQVRYHFLFLNALGFPPDLYQRSLLTLSTTPSAANSIQQKLKSKGYLSDKPLIGVHVGAIGGKAFPIQKYIAYLKLLLDSLDCYICLTGIGPHDNSLKESIVSTLPQENFLDFIDQTTLLELIALISLYDAYVGIDTGPTHIASALKIPQITISTSKRLLPYKWGPWLNRHFIVRNNLNCRKQPCHARSCPDFFCSENIKPEELLIKTLELLKGQGITGFTDQQNYWFSSCMHILILYDKQTLSPAQAFQDQLTTWQIFSTLAPVNSPHLDQIACDYDIKIFHNLTHKRRLRLFLKTQLLNQKLAHPPLLVHNLPAFKSKIDLVTFYQNKFETRLL